MIISLGSDCSIAYQLKKRGLRHCSLPFDWITTEKFSSVIKLIQNNFNGFLDEDKLKLEYISFAHKFIADEDIAENEIIKDTESNYVYLNIKYGIRFPHEFQEHLMFNYSEFQDKYLRRIERFYDIIHSDEELIFFRYENKKLNSDVLHSFHQLFKDKKYKLILISRKEIEIPDELSPFIQSYLDKSYFVDWKRDTIYWDFIIKNMI